MSVTVKKHFNRIIAVPELTHEVKVMPEVTEIELPDIFTPSDEIETEQSVLDRIGEAKAKLGKRVLILGHHYQRDEVIAFADRTGDSYGLSAWAAKERDAEFVVFCGVHFMAETADILTDDHQAVILPDLSAGCSMADMANVNQVKRAFRQITDMTGEEPIPLTYMNSSAEIKAFCGEHNGAVCTSSNARAALVWAWQHGKRILFIPDEHLGRNTAYKLGIPLVEMVVWDPLQPNGNVETKALNETRIVLWRGYCSVHQRFIPAHVDFFRSNYPGAKIIVHPECRFEVVDQADFAGSTDYIVKRIEQAAGEKPSSQWAIGTEHHLVGRLQKRFRTQLKISNLAFTTCNCATMTRIDPIDLADILEGLVRGNISNRIRVSDSVKKWSKVALDRMLTIATGS